jgi:hypothetical protein
MKLPTFKYHPDPIATGSIIESDEACECCGKEPGFIYEGPIYCTEEISGVCPWCIADGSAAAKFEAEMTDAASVGGQGWEEVSDAIVEEVSKRTPGFRGWQQERWWTHCKDAAEFLGIVGVIDGTLLETPEAKDFVAEIQRDWDFSTDEWQTYVSTPSDEHATTTYVFRCRHCRKLGGYADCG